jgi:Na+-driven multidrug efflux pump
VCVSQVFDGHHVFVSQVFDGITAATGGVLRGAGKQLEILIINVLGFWGVGVSLGALLTFVVGWRLKGLWTGMMVGSQTTGQRQYSTSSNKSTRFEEKLV